MSKRRSQTLLQSITTNWHWIKYFQLQYLNTCGYSWARVKPWLRPKTLRKIDAVNYELSALRTLIDRDIAAAKKRIKHGDKGDT